jgi:hypothetical protein
MRGFDTVLALSDSADSRWGIVELMRRAARASPSRFRLLF